MSALGGSRLARIDVCHVPPAGAWWASVVLASGAAAPALGPTTLQIGSDLPLVGAVIRSGIEAPEQPRAVVVGAPGLWRPLTRAETWQSDAGVRLKVVLQALARATGDTFVLPADRSVGPAFGWPMAASYAPSTGAMVLGRLADPNGIAALSTWRVAPSGEVLFTPWPATGAADSKGRPEPRNAVVGRRVMRLDTRAMAFLPGATIDGVAIARSIYREDADGLRVEAWVS
jgi:hypothetical protein